MKRMVKHEKAPAKAPKTRRGALSVGQTAKLFAACRTEREYVVIVLLLHTGLRVAELASLTPANVLREEKLLWVAGKGSKRRGPKRREIDLSPEALAILTKHFATRTTFGIKIRTIRNIITRVSSRAQLFSDKITTSTGLRVPLVSPHILRHTYAVNCLREKIPLNAVQKALGHNQLTTTAIYLNMHPEDVHEEFRKKRPWATVPKPPAPEKPTKGQK